MYTFYILHFPGFPWKLEVPEIPPHGINSRQRSPDQVCVDALPEPGSDAKGVHSNRGWC